MSDTQAESSASTIVSVPLSEPASETSRGAASLNESQISRISSYPITDANAAGASRNAVSSSTPRTVPAQISSDADGVAGTAVGSSIAITSSLSTSAVPVQSKGNVSNSKATSTFNPMAEPPPNDTALVFNSTVAITLNSTSPMVNLEDPAFLWKLDPVTGYRTYGAEQRLHSGRMEVLRFVGVGYGMNGSAGFNAQHDFSGPPSLQSNYTGVNLVSAPGFHRSLNLTPDSPNLGEMYNFNLSSYLVALTYPADVNISFHNATFHVPLKTQAPNFTAMLSQAKTVPVNVNDRVSPLMDTTMCTVRQELEDMYTDPYNPAPNFEPSRIVWNAIDGGLLLYRTTELVYGLPSNTTLVEVIGPVGNGTLWKGNSECYAVLNPRPSWWQYANIPRSSSFKIVNATDQTVFLLPIDPSIKYELRVGALGNATTCPLSAIRTYPFHYDFSADIVNSTNSNTNLTPGSKKANSTPIIVGVVVGVAGGLILLSIMGWFLRRHRRQREEREKEYLPDPYSNDRPVEPRSKAELLQMASGEEAPRQVSDEEASDVETTSHQRRRRGHRIVQEEDGESVVEYLPPQYREAWQAGAEHGPSHPSPGEFVHDPTESEVQHLGGPSSAPLRDRALEEKVRGFDSSDRPPLKQAYARVFSRALPQPPTSMSSSQRQSGNDASESDLKQEYMRRFGPSPRGPREAGESPRVHAEPGSGSFNGADERKAQPNSSMQGALSSVPRPPIDRRLSFGSADFADRSSSSQQGDNLKEEYKRWFS